MKKAIERIKRVLMGYLMAIDAGTGSARAVIFDENGREKGSFGKEWTHSGEDGVAGAMNFDTDNGWKVICECVKGALQKAPYPQAKYPP